MLSLDQNDQKHVKMCILNTHALVKNDRPFQYDDIVRWAYFLHSFQFPIVIQLDRLLEHQNVDTAQSLPQWQSLRAMIYCSPDCEKRLEMLTWGSINRSYSDTKKSLLSLIDLILTLPASTAECERGFSAMKRVKLDWR